MHAEVFGEKYTDTFNLLWYQQIKWIGGCLHW